MIRQLESSNLNVRSYQKFFYVCWFLIPSLLTAFQRMERQGLVTSDWRASDNNRRAKYYALTAKGRRHLDDETADWRRRAAAVARLLEV